MQSIRQVNGRGLIPLSGGYQELSVTGVATGFTLPGGLVIPPDSYVQIQGDPIRYRVDGTVPTATSGFLAWDHDGILLNRFELSNFRAILATGSSASKAVVQMYA